VRGGNKDLLTPALDLIVPPITLLALLLTAMVFVAAIATLANASLYPLVISLISAHLGLGQYGREILPLKSFVLISRYFLGKLNLYRAVLLGVRTSRWIRTDRS
jgi:hypothetical protein